MKQAVITILGIQSPKYNNEGIALVKNYEHQASYYFSENNKSIKKYYNTLPLLIENYSREYEIVPIYTKEAKIFNEDVLRHQNIDCNFNDELGLISDENNYFEIFSKIDKTINSFDKVIIDLTHGFRHLPILTIIDIVIQNFKAKTKIEKILFAKEIIKHTPKDAGEYEIIDLNEYLEIANLSFIITNFKDNYTISSNIKIRREEYKELIYAMRDFSRDILALSMQHLYNISLPNLHKAIDNISDISILKNDLLELSKHLDIFKFEGKKKFEIYFNTAKELLGKDYLLQSINLLHEAKQFYLKTAIKSQNEETYSIIDKIEKELDGNLFKLLQDCLTIYFQKEPKKLSLIKLEDAKILKANLKFDYKFTEFLKDDLRNTLSHAYSTDSKDDTDIIKNVKGEIAKNIQKFEQFCIENDVLKLKKNSL